MIQRHSIACGAGRRVTLSYLLLPLMLITCRLLEDAPSGVWSYRRCSATCFSLRKNLEMARSGTTMSSVPSSQ